jgi:hypothetical protein
MTLIWRIWSRVREAHVRVTTRPSGNAMPTHSVPTGCRPARSGPGDTGEREADVGAEHAPRARRHRGAASSLTTGPSGTPSRSNLTSLA